jgi:hypothetical protein
MGMGRPPGMLGPYDRRYGPPSEQELALTRAIRQRRGMRRRTTMAVMLWAMLGISAISVVVVLTVFVFI